MLSRSPRPYRGKHRHIVGRHRRKSRHTPRHRALLPGSLLLKAGLLSVAVGAAMLVAPAAIDLWATIHLGAANGPRARQSMKKATSRALAGSLDHPSAAVSSPDHWPTTSSSRSEPPATLLLIPEISLEEPLHFAPADEESQQKTLRLGPTHYGGTALPGSSGNVVIGGHNGSAASLVNTSFRRLGELGAGAEILLATKDHTYRYVVEEKRAVHEEDVRQVIEDEPGATITLYTCTPRTNPFLRPTTRLVVRGALKSVDRRDARGVFPEKL